MRESEEEIIEQCEALGHTMKKDPPKTRWTCTNRACGRAVLTVGGPWYGSALTNVCVP